MADRELSAAQPSAHPAEARQSTSPPDPAARYLLRAGSSRTAPSPATASPAPRPARLLGVNYTRGSFLLGRMAVHSLSSGHRKENRSVLLIIALGAGVTAQALTRSRVARRLRVAVQKYGVGGTIQVLMGSVADIAFDLRYGTDTKRRVDLADMDTRGPSAPHAVHYEATRPREFHKLMSRLGLPSGGVFVDIGSGKGRVLLMASNYGFRRVLGIEFSPALCEVARSNILAYRQRRRPLSAPMEVITSDACEYQFSDDETVFFLYNPFDAWIVNIVLGHIKDSIHRRPRQIWIIYHHPVFADVFEDEEFLSSAINHGFVAFRVYTNK